jgi:hypothetical protein
MGVQEIWSGHTPATLARIRTQEVVLLVQDTTFLQDGTTQPQAGMGTVKINTREEYLLHPTVALTPERVNLGVVGIKVWQRPAQPGAQQRNSKPIEEQERYRWLAGYQGACAVKQACPATVVVNMADRAGDIQDWYVDTMRREPDQRAECMIRAKWHRRIVPGSAQQYFWAERQPTHALGTRTIELARQPEGPPRSVTLSVTAKPVTFHGARRPGGKLPPVTVSAVYAREPSPSQGEAPIAWVRLPSLPVTEVPRACTVVPWSRGRWDMELLFRVLTHGGQLAQVRVQTDQRVLNALAIYLIVAWRIHNITMAGRGRPPRDRDTPGWGLSGAGPGGVPCGLGAVVGAGGPPPGAEAGNLPAREGAAGHLAFLPQSQIIGAYDSNSF